MKENLFLKDIKESGLKPEEGCCCQVCRILRQQEDKTNDPYYYITQVLGKPYVGDKIDKEIANSSVISNPYTKGLRDSIPARKFIKEDIRPISGNLYNESTKTIIESINCECKVDPIG